MQFFPVKYFLSLNFCMNMNLIPFLCLSLLPLLLLSGRKPQRGEGGGEKPEKAELRYLSSHMFNDDNGYEYISYMISMNMTRMLTFFVRCLDQGTSQV